jgi:imidazole glycerol phosphate synthase subunit HisF
MKRLKAGIGKLRTSFLVCLQTFKEATAGAGFIIGSNRTKNYRLLEIIIEQSKVPVIIDAGIGSPSDAAKAMELEPMLF